MAASLFVSATACPRTGQPVGVSSREIKYPSLKPSNNYENKTQPHAPKHTNSKRISLQKAVALRHAPDKRSIEKPEKFTTTYKPMPKYKLR